MKLSDRTTIVDVSKDKLESLTFDIIDLIMEKNKDYKDAWQRYGIFTPLIRLNDKLLRVENLIGGHEALIADEKVEDTLKDIVGYALLALLWLNEDSKHSE